MQKLGIPLKEQMVLAGVEGADAAPADAEGDKRKVAVDAVFDSVSVGTTFKDELAKAGVIFCSISEAVQEHPELVKKYLGSVIPNADNIFATLNAAVFTDGSFVYIPPGVRCPMELSTYFRINAENTGQFERTLIIADKGSYVSYLEGCTAPQRDTHQLHAACVELIALDDAEIKYSTVQNWYPGDENGKGGIYNFVTKRADCRGDRSKVMWTQVETGSAVTWKYPSCILRGDDSQGEFYSIAIANNWQQADTGTKMTHLGKNTRSRIVSKGISAGHAQNTYRGLVSMHPKAKNSRNFTQCDSLLIGGHLRRAYGAVYRGQEQFLAPSTRRRHPRSMTTRCSIAARAAWTRKRPWRSWSTASARTCCRRCRWSSRWRRSSSWRSRWKDRSADDRAGDRERLAPAGDRVAHAVSPAPVARGAPAWVF